MTEFHKILTERREELAMSRKDVADALLVCGFKVSERAISSWETGHGVPNALIFIALCDILKIDDVLWTFAGLRRGPFAELNESGRDKASEHISLLLNHEPPLYRLESQRADAESKPDCAESKHSVGAFDHVGGARFRPIYDSRLPADAGNSAFEHHHEVLEVPERLSDTIDFGVRMSGDSMAPLYRDDQIVWGQKCEMLDSGDIGIFMYDGTIHVKELLVFENEGYLRSLNEEYEDIKIDDDFGFSILGKVVASRELSV